jgi:hypothetical protein
MNNKTDALTPTVELYEHLEKVCNMLFQSIPNSEIMAERKILIEHYAMYQRLKATVCEIKDKVSEIQHTFDTLGNPYCIDKDPETVDIKWIRANAYRPFDDK